MLSRSISLAGAPLSVGRPARSTSCIKPTAPLRVSRTSHVTYARKKPQRDDDITAQQSVSSSESVDSVVDGYAEEGTTMDEPASKEDPAAKEGPSAVGWSVVDHADWPSVVDGYAEEGATMDEPAAKKEPSGGWSVVDHAEEPAGKDEPAVKEEPTAGEGYSGEQRTRTVAPESKAAPSPPAPNGSKGLAAAAAAIAATTRTFAAVSAANTAANAAAASAATASSDAEDGAPSSGAAKGASSGASGGSGGAGSAPSSTSGGVSGESGPAPALSALKTRLLIALSSLDRGLAASGREIEEVEEMARKLEKMGGAVDLSSPRETLSGSWRLCYTSGFNTGSLGGRRPGPPAALVPTQLGQVFQVIDASTGKLDNIVELLLPNPLGLRDSPALRVTLRHDYEVQGQATVQIVFEDTSAELVGSDFFRNFPRFDVPSLPDVLKPPRFMRSAKFDVTFLDDGLRVTRGDRGELRVYARDAQPQA
ncbi:hypothetical protein FOA52_015167 [Chlamydomonas sp. UWO 241]|nr:hypothetical protein FOA52_015167 [Chlamydomonas sp. UWO 241]